MRPGTSTQAWSQLDEEAVLAGMRHEAALQASSVAPQSPFGGAFKIFGQARAQPPLPPSSSYCEPTCLNCPIPVVCESWCHLRLECSGCPYCHKEDEHPQGPRLELCPCSEYRNGNPGDQGTNLACVTQWAEANRHICYPPERDPSHALSDSAWRCPADQRICELKQHFA